MSWWACGNNEPTDKPSAPHSIPYSVFRASAGERIPYSGLGEAYSVFRDFCRIFEVFFSLSIQFESLGMCPYIYTMHIFLV